MSRWAKGWTVKYGSVFRFLLVFCVLMGVFYTITVLSPLYRGQVFPWYLRLNARVAGWLLRVLGQQISVVDNSISSPSFSVSIVRGCDAVEPTALFVCAVLAFPVHFMKKIPGVITGILFLALVNLVRILSLFLIGVYLPKLFEVMHVDTWQALFILLALLFWCFWLLWASKSPTPIQTPSG